MMYFPSNGLVDGFGVPVDGHLRLMAAIAILALLAAYAVLLWAVRTSWLTKRPDRPSGTTPGPEGPRIAVEDPARHRGQHAA